MKDALRVCLWCVIVLPGIIVLTFLSLFKEAPRTFRCLSTRVLLFLLQGGLSLPEWGRRILREEYRRGGITYQFPGDFLSSRE